MCVYICVCVYVYVCVYVSKSHTILIKYIFLDPVLFSTHFKSHPNSWISTMHFSACNIGQGLANISLAGLTFLLLDGVLTYHSPLRKLLPHHQETKYI